MYAKNHERVTVPLSIPQRESTTRSWQEVLRKNFTTIHALIRFLELSENDVAQLDLSSPFIVNIPLRLAEKIEKRNIHDPLFRQFVPLKEETIPHTGYSKDPVNDHSFQKEAKLLQKYYGRSLIITTSACAMHCRYCFRKNFPYETQEKGFEKELTLLRNDPSITEVILSGGDPLSLPDKTLALLLEEINALFHVRRVRFHTRFPIGIPERIDTSFIATLQKSQKQLWFVLHCNHPRELDKDVRSHLKKLQTLGIPLLNQSVLLKGVNDSLETQKELCESLIDHGIVPYYLHNLDKVEGTKHFEVSQEEGHTLIEKLQAVLPGYAVPKYVQEIPGKPSKTLLHSIHSLNL